MYSVAPGSLASLLRKRATTWSALSLRWFTGLSTMNMKAELRWPPPVKPTTLSTAGSARTTARKRSSRARMAWNEVAWSACIEPMMRPVSCCGKKPLGITTYR